MASPGAQIYERRRIWQAYLPEMIRNGSKFNSGFTLPEGRANPDVLNGYRR